MVSKPCSQKDDSNAGFTLPQLFGAMAAPLSCHEAGQLAPELLNDGSYLVQDGYLEPAVQADFPTLRDALARHPELATKLRHLDTMRQKDSFADIDTPRMQKRLLPAAARRALLQGDKHLFTEAYHEFKHIIRNEISEEKALINFWERVLGTHWQGHECVPEGKARQELDILLGMRYILTPREGLAPLPVKDMPVMLRLAAHMAAGEAQALSKIAADGTEGGDAAKQACLLMLKGDWKAANKLFTDVFRPQNILIYWVLENQAAPLLVFALLCALRAGARKPQLTSWLHVLQRVLPEYVPAAEKEGMTAFTRHLQVAGKLIAGQEQPHSLYSPFTPLSCLPLAFCYRNLRASLREKADPQRLLSAIDTCAQHGSALLAYYAATPLLGTEFEFPEPVRDLVQRMREQGVRPLFEGMFSEPGDTEDLLEVLKKHMRQAMAPKEQLHWEIILDKDKMKIKGLRPSIQSSAPGTRKRDISIDQCYSAATVEQDMAALYLGGGFAAEEPMLSQWISALAGHPHLRLSLPGKRIAEISLRAEKPRIVIQREGAYILLSLRYGEYGELRPLSDTEWAVTRHSARLDCFRAFLHAYGRKGKLALPARQADKLYLLLNEWSDDFDYEGTLSEGKEAKKEDCRLIALAFFQEDGVEIRLGAQVLPGVETLVVPGEGQPRLDVKTPQGIWAVDRDFDTEKKLVQGLCERIPALVPTPRHTWKFADTVKGLECLTHMESAGLPLIRNGREPLHCYTPSATTLTLQVRGIGGEWFDIGGEVKVNEELTFQLNELLDALDLRIGSFLPVNGGYLHMPEPMEHQLSTLKVLLGSKGRSRGISAAALPTLSESVGEKNLPPALRERMERMHKEKAPPPPGTLNATLRPYQLQGFHWLVERANAGIGACLADDMGLGKTIQLTALLLHVAHRGPSLVIAPLSLQGNWVKELAKFAPTLRVLPFSPHQPHHTPKANEVVLASYGQVSNNLPNFSSIPWNVLALDEAQAIKNADSQRAKAVYNLHAAARVCLTGTPVENSELDLWGLMHFLNPLLLGTKASFRRRFMGDATGTALLGKLVSTLILRRTKEEVLPQLPPMVEQVLPVELGEEERALYEAARRRALAHLSGDDNRISALAELMHLRRACCDGRLLLPEFEGPSTKISMLDHVLGELKKSGHKALVFSQFTDMLDLVEARLQASGFRMERLDGTTPAKQRTQAVERFQKGEADVFLISMKAGGMGLNLTAADYVILLDPWWNPATEAQAASRSHRLGQQNPVTVYRLIATHTVEERVLQLHAEKKELAETLLSGGSLPLEHLRQLLED